MTDNITPTFTYYNHSVYWDEAALCYTVTRNGTPIATIRDSSARADAIRLAVRDHDNTHHTLPLVATLLTATLLVIASFALGRRTASTPIKGFLRHLIPR
jgi:hypothetical protein